MDAVLARVAPVLPLAARRLEHPVRGNESLRDALWGAAMGAGRVEVAAGPPAAGTGSRGVAAACGPGGVQLGPDHPDTLGSRFKIVELLMAGGDTGEALRLTNELIPDQTRVLGPDHEATLCSRVSQALCTGLRNPARERVPLMGCGGTRR